MLLVVHFDGSFMRAIISIMRSSSSSTVSTFLPYTKRFIQLHKQKSNGVRSGDLGGQLTFRNLASYI